jgi:hypothetical protein
MFGDTKKMAEAIVGGAPDEAPKGGDDSGKEDAAMQLIDAIGSADPAGVVTALKALMEILESEPHEEAEHDEE